MRRSRSRSALAAQALERGQQLLARPAPVQLPAPTDNPPPKPEAPAVTVTADQAGKLKLYDGPSRGPANAPVTIVVFQDNICPYCGHALGTLDQIVDEYAGKVKIVVKQFPVHKDSVLSSEASYAADAQGKFWELHDVMFQHQDDLSRDALIKYAQQVGVRGTPAFLINGHELSGAQPVENFRALIDTALREAP